MNIPQILVILLIVLISVQLGIASMFELNVYGIPIFWVLLMLYVFLGSASRRKR